MLVFNRLEPEYFLILEPKKMSSMLTARQQGTVWAVRFCLVGPPLRNLSEGKTSYEPRGAEVGPAKLIIHGPHHPCCQLLIDICYPPGMRVGPIYLFI